MNVPFLIDVILLLLTVLQIQWNQVAFCVTINCKNKKVCLRLWVIFFHRAPHPIPQTALDLHLIQQNLPRGTGSRSFTVVDETRLELTLFWYSHSCLFYVNHVGLTLASRWLVIWKDFLSNGLFLKWGWQTDLRVSILVTTFLEAPLEEAGRSDHMEISIYTELTRKGLVYYESLHPWEVSSTDYFQDFLKDKKQTNYERMLQEE